MKTIDYPQCSRRGCKGICIAVQVSLIETATGVERFRCDNCGREYVFRYREPELATTTRKENDE